MQINQKYIKIYPNKSTIIQFISLKNVLPRVKELIKDNNKKCPINYLSKFNFVWDKHFEFLLHVYHQT